MNCKTFPIIYAITILIDNINLVCKSAVYLRNFPPQGTACLERVDLGGGNGEGAGTVR